MIKHLIVEVGGNILVFDPKSKCDASWNQKNRPEKLIGSGYATYNMDVSLTHTWDQVVSHWYEEWPE